MKKKLLFALLAATAVLALGLSGCSGDDDGDVTLAILRNGTPVSGEMQVDISESPIIFSARVPKNKTATFSSSAASVAYVAPMTGVVELYKAGTTTITLTVQDTGKAASVTLKVSGERDPLPEYIGSNFGEDANTQLLVSWQNKSTVTTQYVEITQKSDTAFSSATRQEVEGVSFISTGATGTYPERNVFRAKVEGLTAGTEYIYRVGNAASWSQPRNHRTAGTGEFSFAMFSDPQDHTSFAKALSVTLANAHTYDSNAAFYLMTGDIVENISNPDHIKGFFDAAVTQMKLVPFTTVQGNHDTYNTGASQVNGEKSVYEAFFYNPGNGPANLTNSTYYYYYNDLLVVMLFTTIASHNDQAAWLRQLLQDDRDGKNIRKSKYILVGMHHGPFSNHYYNNGSITNMRNTYGKIFSDFDVDLVVFGHDHTYGRTYPLKIAANGAVDNYAGSPNGTVYSLNGSTGEKFYDATYETFAEQAEKQWAKCYLDLRLETGATGAALSTSANLVNAGMFVNIKVTNTELSIEAFNNFGKKLDSYPIPAKQRN